MLAPGEKYFESVYALDFLLRLGLMNTDPFEFADKRSEIGGGDTVSGLSIAAVSQKGGRKSAQKEEKQQREAVLSLFCPFTIYF